MICEPEGEPSLVAEPRVVHVVVVAREVPGDVAAAKVHPEVAPARTVRTDRVPGAQIERPGNESVRRGGEGADGADLDDVPAERRSEVLAGRDADLLGGAPVEQLDEPVPADLVAETRAPRAEDAAFTVQSDERR